MNTDKPTSITLNLTSKTLSVGSTYQLSVSSVTPSTASNSVTWSSSDDTTVSVSSSGLIRGIKEGQATITATSTLDTNVSASCLVTVTTNVDPNSPTSIELSETEMELPVDWIDQLQVTRVVPETASKQVTWSSSDETVVKVAAGYITTLKVGTAVITATSTVNTSVSATCNISVVDYSGGGNSSSEVPPTSDSETPKPDDNKKKGCFGSISVATIIIPVVLGVSLITLVCLRKKEDQ